MMQKIRPVLPSAPPPPLNVIPSAARDLLLALTVATLLAACFLVGPAQAQKKPPPPNPLDLNTATQKQLEELPGVGPVTAKAIVDFRQKGGPFRRVDDLLVVRGISEGRLKRIRPYVFVKPPDKPPSKPVAKPAVKPAQLGQPAASAKP
jgi:competence ComEA-like helix-hairpin-helix protein